MSPESFWRRKDDAEVGSAVLYIQAGSSSAVTICSDRRHPTAATAALTSLGAMELSNCSTWHKLQTHQNSRAPCTTAEVPQAQN